MTEDNEGWDESSIVDAGVEQFKINLETSLASVSLNRGVILLILSFLLGIKNEERPKPWPWKAGVKDFP